MKDLGCWIAEVDNRLRDKLRHPNERVRLPHRPLDQGADPGLALDVQMHNALGPAELRQQHPVERVARLLSAMDDINLIATHKSRKLEQVNSTGHSFAGRH